MSTRVPSQLNLGVSVAIRQEIQRFESVHPSIYAIYDLIDDINIIEDPTVQEHMRDLVTSIEGRSTLTQSHRRGVLFDNQTENIFVYAR